MKKILLFLLVFISVRTFAQYPNGIQTLGSDSNLVQPKGGFKARVINWTFTDTTQANTQHIKQYPGAQIFTTSDNKFWLRNALADTWIGVGSGGATIDTTAQFVKLITYVNDSTIRVWIGATNYTVRTGPGAAGSGGANGFDSVHVSSDSLFLCNKLSGACTFAFKTDTTIIYTVDDDTRISEYDTTTHPGYYTWFISRKNWRDSLNGKKIDSGAYIPNGGVLSYDSAAQTHVYVNLPTYPPQPTPPLDDVLTAGNISAQDMFIGNVTSTGDIDATTGSVTAGSSVSSGGDVAATTNVDIGISGTPNHAFLRMFNGNNSSGVGVLYADSLSNIGRIYQLPDSNGVFAVSVNNVFANAKGNINIPVGGSGTVTNIATGYGLSGGAITTTGTLIADSATLSNYYVRRKDSVATGYYPYSTNPKNYLTTIDTTNIANFSTKVRSLISATAPITYVNGLIGITQATTSTNGYLSSTDWNTFNNKQSTISVTAPITLTGASVGMVNQGTATTVLHGNASGNPSFSAVGLATDVTGTLPVANGGTNLTTYTTGDILYASATNVLSKLPIGTASQTLHVVSGLPAWKDTTASAGGGSSGIIYDTVPAWNRVGTVLQATLASEGSNIYEPTVWREGSPQILTDRAIVFKMIATRNWGQFSRDIGYYESPDGYTWAAYSGNPVVTGHSRSSVLKVSSTYYMYAANNAATQIDRYTSSDGKTWTLATSAVVSYSPIYNCSVIYDGTWRMLVDGYGGGGYYQNYYSSADGITWTAYGSNPVIPAGTGTGAPYLWKVGSTYYVWLLESGSAATLPSDIYRWSSPDMITWTRATASGTPDFPRRMFDEGAEKLKGQVADPTLVSVVNNAGDSSVYMFNSKTFDGSDSAARQSIELEIFSGSITKLVGTKGGDKGKIIPASAFARVDSLNLFYPNGSVSIGSVGKAATSSILDLTSTTKSFLPPRMTTTQMNAISSPATGSTIYNTTVNSLYYYNGTAWINPAGWSLIGNSGLDSTVNWIGTLDTKPLQFRQNNVARGGIYSALTSVWYGSAPNAGTLSPAVNNTIYGYAAATVITNGSDNVVLGHSAATGLTTGIGNVVAGKGAGVGITTHNYNSYYGDRAGQTHVGTGNTGLGKFALNGGASGDYNTGVGYNALQATTGNYNVAIGLHSGFTNTSGTNNIFIGPWAGYYLSTLSNRIIFNSIDRTTLTLDTTNSVFYATQNATATSQITKIGGGGLTGINGYPNSSLGVNGSFSAAYVAKTGTYTATISDYTIDCTSGTFTVTLPTAVGIAGRIYFITNSGAGTITVGTTSSQTFANVTATPTTLVMATVGAIQVQSNGANWLQLK